MQQEKFIIDLLYEKYGKMIYSKKESAKILGISISGIDRLRKKKIIYPIENEKMVYFPIQELARYLTTMSK